ncbi:hypothetical protein [Streptomyces sp. MJM8645]|uniref:hypothetical protein n=1 Tax=Streptomyces sp. MJM8645 TaxID=1120523 RepID=UPI0007AF7125|nr:hypothetical protein [Streptomyces sp. MJM8645]
MTTDRQGTAAEYEADRCIRPPSKRASASPECQVCRAFDKIAEEFAKSPQLPDESVLRAIAFRRLDHELKCKAVARVAS